MERLVQDIRYSLRVLLKAPGFAVVAVISLALGIGANTAIFSVVREVLLKSLPYAEADRIVLVWGHDREEATDRNQVSATDVADFRKENTVFEDITTYGNWSCTVADDGNPERVQGMQVGDGYFSIMRGTPLLGRAFLPEDQEPGKDFVVILSYGFWQRKFSADPEVVGRKVELSGRPYTIVGVMPSDFESLPPSLVNATAQLYRPVAEPYDESQRSARHLRAIARLRPGVDIKQARAEMTAIAQRLEEAHPDKNHDYGVRVVSITEDTVGGIRTALLLLFGAVGLVLLIACANVANLLLARAAARQKEIAIRAALGAGRLRLVRQFLTESALLALAGGALGLLTAMWSLSLIESFGSKVHPLLNGIEINGGVLAFTLAISLLTGLLFGIVPALHASKPDLNESLKEGGRNSGAGAGGGRLRNLFVVAQVAMALVLLVSAGLLIRSVIHLSRVDPGFDTKNLLTMNVWLPFARYPDGAKWIAFYDQLAGRVGTLPGVRATGFVSVLPLSSNFDGRGLQVEDKPAPEGQGPEADLYIVTPGYLRAMGIALKSGRLISDEDRQDGMLVALVNESMARTLWPGQGPLGKRISLSGGPNNPRLWRTVVGVVADVKQYGLDKQPPMQFYLPETQFPTSAMTLVVRTGTDPESLVAAVRKEILSLDNQIAAFNITTMDQLRSDSMALRRFSMLLLGLFAGLAMVLAAVGIYGVMSYAVTQRTHEIGIRVALGASRSDVLRMVVGQGVALTASGVAIGVAASLAITRVMESLLYGVGARDWETYVVITGVLGMVSVMASLIPARRATKVDPMEALRYE
ncbi:MAG TPA: ABC transporter permease [Blastocatellia bacterium]|nr:ABC transporter permease [Blastocatellia bacterium]